MLRYVVHADYSPTQVYSQTAYLNEHENRELIAFTNRDGSASVLLPEGAVLAGTETNSEGRGVTIFHTHPPEWSYTSAWSDNVEEITL